QAFDHMAVVHDLMAHVDRWTIEGQRALDDVDRPDDARAEASGLGQNDLHAVHLDLVATATAPEGCSPRQAPAAIRAAMAHRSRSNSPFRKTAARPMRPLDRHVSALSLALSRLAS